MKKRTFLTVPLVLTIALSILLGLPFLSSAQVGPISGAIFTTDETGLLVDGNIYANALDVYLSGGPGPNAPPTAAGLPDGEYYFQVTNPPGKKLLSTDGVEERKFLVEGGVITQYLGTTHNWNDISSEIPNAIVIQLWPFGKTPNKGGVYKAWATPVEDYDPTDPHSFWGFIPRYSKTDNYKVQRERPIARLILDKFYDVDNSGFYDNDDYLIVGWPIDVTDPLGVTNTYYTPKVIDVTGNPGTYTITEDLLDGWEQTAVAVDGTYMPVAVTVTVEIVNGETHSIFYGNREIPTPPPAKLIVRKFNDTDSNGRYDEGIDIMLTGWKIDIKDPDGVTTSYLTPIDLDVTNFGTYIITEDLPSGWEQTALRVDGIYVAPTVGVTIDINAGETHDILYGNKLRPTPPPPPPVGIHLDIRPISVYVGSPITFSWVIESPPEVTPNYAELYLKNPDGIIISLHTYTPPPWTGSYVWTSTLPTGLWRGYIEYHYTYLGNDYTVKAYAGFRVRT